MPPSSHASGPPTNRAPRLSRDAVRDHDPPVRPIRSLRRCGGLHLRRGRNEAIPLTTASTSSSDDATSQQCRGGPWRGDDVNSAVITGFPKTVMRCEDNENDDGVAPSTPARGLGAHDVAYGHRAGPGLLRQTTTSSGAHGRHGALLEFLDARRGRYPLRNDQDHQSPGHRSSAHVDQRDSRSPLSHEPRLSRRHDGAVHRPFFHFRRLRIFHQSGIPIGGLPSGHRFPARYPPATDAGGRVSTSSLRRHSKGDIPTGSAPRLAKR